MDFETRFLLSHRALELALRTSGVPQRLDYFFPEELVEALIDPKRDGPAKRARVKTEFQNKEWQKQFLVVLSSKGAITINGNFYAVKNRYFLENLLKEFQAKKPNALLEIVWVAGGGEPGGWQTAFKTATSVDEPKPAPPAPPIDPRLQSPIEILKRIEEAVTLSLTIQEKLAENIIYVRDRGDKLHDRFKNLSERLAIIEAKLELPVQGEIDGGQLKEQFVAMTESVNSIGTAVHSMKADVHQVMESTLNQKASDRIAQIQASLTHITNEFEALRELALESFDESAR